jgi:hypothetical protein
MYIITLDGKEEEGAYSVTNEYGEQVLYIFEEEDDAIRFAMMLEEDRNYPSMHVIEVDDDAMLTACREHNYEYNIFSQHDFVIPPDEEENDFI